MAQNNAALPTRKPRPRYGVDPIDNLGDVDPPPPRDRTWGVVDRIEGEYVAEFDRRVDARAYARQLNEGAA
jgi:hypothetical protein